MPDREKVIKGLHDLRRYLEDKEWSDKTAGLYWETVTDTITMLKEQEAKPMTEYDDGWDCPRCGLKLVGKTASGYPCDELDLPNDEIVKYCPVCGQAVKWDD